MMVFSFVVRKEWVSLSTNQLPEVPLMSHLEELLVLNCFQMTFKMNHVVEFDSCSRVQRISLAPQSLRPETFYREHVPCNLSLKRRLQLTILM